MKKLLFISISSILFFCVLVIGAGPLYRHKEPEKQLEFENVYKDISRAGNKKGTVTNDSAAAGYIGEYISSATASDANQNLYGSANYGNTVGITLTAGDWDVTACVQFFSNGATYTRAYFGIGTVAGNDSTGILAGINTLDAPLPLIGVRGGGVCVSNWRTSISSSVTYYLKVNGEYTVAVGQYQGRISARRMR